MTQLHDYSAGGIVRDAAGRVAIIQVESIAGNLIWGLPKGHPHDGEEPATTALRETAEETGLEVALVVGTEPGAIEYEFFNRAGRHVHKRVDFYLMTAVGGDITQHDDEVIRVGWFTLAEALELMAYANERDLLRRMCR